MRGYRDSLEVPKDSQGNLTPGADLNPDILPEVVYNDEDRDFDGAIGEESAQHVGVKWK